MKLVNYAVRIIAVALALPFLLIAVVTFFIAALSGAVSCVFILLGGVLLMPITSLWESDFVKAAMKAYKNDEQKELQSAIVKEKDG